MRWVLFGVCGALAGAATAAAGCSGEFTSMDGDDGSTDAAADGTTPEAPSESAPDATRGADAGADAASVTDSGADADAGADSGADPDATPCTDAGTCLDHASTCCAGYCVDTHTDPRNCGACGVACTASQFCNGVACWALVLDNACRNATATVVLDSLPSDDDAGASIGAALATCVPAVAVAAVAQNAGPLEPVTNRPVTGVGNSFVAGGGPFAQLGLQYMNAQSLMPVYVAAYGGGTVLAFETRDGGTVVSTPLSAVTPTHDYFVVMVATEPASGTLLLTAYGMLSGGTSAAAWWFQNHMAPLIVADGGFPKEWTVYEWTDVNADGPDPSDTWTLLGSGP